MRTHTLAFRSHLIGEFRMLGLSWNKSRIAARAIINAIADCGFPKIADTSKARISFDSHNIQSVYIDVDGLAMFHVQIPEKFQPLVNYSKDAPVSAEPVETLKDLYESRLSWLA